VAQRLADKQDRELAIRRPDAGGERDCNGHSAYVAPLGGNQFDKYLIGAQSVFRRMSAAVALGEVARDGAADSIGLLAPPVW
jgi:hypothetical protein